MYKHINTQISTREILLHCTKTIGGWGGGGGGGGSMKLIKSGTYVKSCTNYYLCLRFESNNIKNGLGSAKNFGITNLVIMCIFNEVE